MRRGIRRNLLWNMRKKLTISLLGTIVPCALYTGYIFSLNKPKIFDEREFRVGSTNYMVMDSLQTGDVILFSRKWYRYHIPVALYIKLYQVFHSEYDHCGVVVVDSKGEPHIYENTPFRGHQLRRLDERVFFSQACFVGAVPLLPRGQISSSDARRLYDLASETSSNKASSSSSSQLDNELWAQYKALGRFFWGSVFGFSATADAAKPVYCDNIRLLLSSFLSLGLRRTKTALDEDAEVLTLQQVFDRDIRFRKKKDASDATAPPTERKKNQVITLGSSILIKTT